MPSDAFEHIPVLLNEVIGFLPATTRCMIDFTVGGANHAYAMLAANRQAFLYGIDRDQEALHASRGKLTEFDGRFSLIHGAFSSAIEVLRRNQVTADFILADLGVSSHQLTLAARGFSLRQEGPLDMRMDSTRLGTAADIVNSYEEKELSSIIKRYGEERFADRIAKGIVTARQKKPFATTLELTESIVRSIPMKFQFGNVHAATKTFQAIRIEVNREIEELNYLLANVLDLLNSKGRLAIISFHSLEDRPVKQMFKTWENPCTCPKEFPICTCGLKPLVKPITRKAIKAGETETAVNIRSRSAKLRVIEKL
jgi:16S rRNA (cytosine1402-N4)-methyltransferase